MKIKNHSSIPSKYWLAIIAVICVILLGIDQVTDGGGPLRFIGDYTVVPMQKGISYVGRWLSDLSDNFETLQDMKKQNETLQSKVDELTIDNTRLRQDENWIRTTLITKKSVHMSLRTTERTGSVILL